MWKFKWQKKLNFERKGVKICVKKKLNYERKSVKVWVKKKLAQWSLRNFEHSIYYTYTETRSHITCSFQIKFDFLCVTGMHFYLPQLRKKPIKSRITTTAANPIPRTTINQSVDKNLNLHRNTINQLLYKNLNLKNLNQIDTSEYYKPVHNKPVFNTIKNLNLHWNTKSERSLNKTSHWARFLHILCTVRNWQNIRNKREFHLRWNRASSSYFSSHC